MKTRELFRFFLKEINFNIWFKVLIKFMLHLLIVFSEILFLSTFFLILNQKVDSKIFSFFHNNLEIYLYKIFGNLNYIEINIILLVFFLFIKNILSIFHLIYFNGFIFSLSVKKSSKLLNSFLNKSYENFKKNEISIYIKHLVRDVENVFVSSFGLIVQFISELIYVIIILLFLKSLVDLNPGFEIYILLFSVIVILYFLFLIAKKFGTLRATTEINVFKTLTDTLNIFKEIKVINSSSDFIKRFDKNLSKWFKTRIAAEVVNFSPKFIFELSILIFFLFIFKNETPKLSMNDFITKYSVFAIAILRLIPNIAKLSSLMSTFLYNLKSIEFIKDDLNKSTNKIRKKVLEKGNLKTINLKGIYLKFINKEDQTTTSKFNNLNINFEKNKIYGIYGRSGSGKTSLLNLLSGFIKPNKGKILFNKKEYKFHDISSKFEIGYSPQDTTILDENIIVNSTLKLNNNNQTKDKLKELLVLFNLKKFTNSRYFENNKKSSIKNMSGGEKQRIGIIRSFLRDPDLILLDEPTSSLDKKNEKKIFQYLLKNKKNKIIVVSSHKESHKKYFDKIINL